MASIDYTQDLNKIVLEFFEKLAEQDSELFDKYQVMSTYFDDFPEEILGLSASDLARACNYATESNLIPTQSDWFKFLTEPIVKGWKSLRTSQALNQGFEKIALNVRDGKFDSPQQAQAFKQIDSIMKDGNKAKDGVVYIKSYFPPLFGERPNGYESVEIDKDDIENG